MASPTQWIWVWASSGSWKWTGRPGMLQCMGLQRVRHNWATELTELNWTHSSQTYWSLRVYHHQLIRELCTSWSQTLRHFSLTWLLKMLCWWCIRLGTQSQCSRKIQRDWVGREVGCRVQDGGDTCIPVPIHADVLQKSSQYCTVIILQLK